MCRCGPAPCAPAARSRASAAADPLQQRRGSALWLGRCRAETKIAAASAASSADRARHGPATVGRAAQREVLGEIEPVMGRASTADADQQRRACAALLGREGERQHQQRQQQDDRRVGDPAVDLGADCPLGGSARAVRRSAQFGQGQLLLVPAAQPASLAQASSGWRKASSVERRRFARPRPAARRRSGRRRGRCRAAALGRSRCGPACRWSAAASPPGGAARRTRRRAPPSGGAASKVTARSVASAGRARAAAAGRSGRR